MPIVAVFEFPTESPDKYQQVFEVGGAAITDQPSRLSHVCYRTGEGFVVVDVWADMASFEAFGPIIGPAAGGAGLDPQPQIFEVEGFMLADGVRNP